jgi:hypothetical protein
VELGSRHGWGIVVIGSRVLQEILDIPWVLMDYQNWLEKAPPPADDDYLFARSRIRFEPSDDDRLVLLDSTNVVEHDGWVGVQISDRLPPIAVPSLKSDTLKALLNALRQRPLLVELPFVANVPSHDCDELIRLGFGRFIFAPDAFATLEQHAAASEIVRFPASPYEIVRNYWQNVGQLSTEVSAKINTPSDCASFETFLRACHVKLLLGADFNTYYRPSSPIARTRVMPGALYTRQTRLVTTPSGVYIIDGPRINATPVGGATYHRLLRKSLRTEGVQQALQNTGYGNENWGAVIIARSRGDARDAEWFVPPRPMGSRHFELLWKSWSRALAAANEQAFGAAISELGGFHWLFVRLHPFACANQSLAFTLVNCVLKRLLGCGIPQLILDQVALRHGYPEYTRLFGRAVTFWQTKAENGLERQKERIQKRQALDHCIAAIASAKSEAEAELTVEQNQEMAQLALLTAPGISAQLQYRIDHEFT